MIERHHGQFKKGAECVPKMADELPAEVWRVLLVVEFRFYPPPALVLLNRELRRRPEVVILVIRPPLPWSIELELPVGSHELATPVGVQHIDDHLLCLSSSTIDVQVCTPQLLPNAQHR